MAEEKVHQAPGEDEPGGTSKVDDPAALNKKLDYYRDKTRKLEAKNERSLKLLGEANEKLERLAPVVADIDDLRSKLRILDDLNAHLNEELKLRQSGDDRVVLSGQSWPISRRMTVEDMVREWRMRHVMPGHTVLLIEKEGG